MYYISFVAEKDFDPGLQIAQQSLEVQHNFESLIIRRLFALLKNIKNFAQQSLEVQHNFESLIIHRLFALLKNIENF